MIKKFFICFLLLSSCFFPINKVFAQEEVDTKIINQLNTLGLEEVDNRISQIQKENEGFEEFSFGEMMKKIVTGEFDISFSGILKKGLSVFFGEIQFQLQLIEKLFIIAILSAILKNINASFYGKSVGELGFYVCYMVLIMIIIASFSSQANMVGKTIEKMITAMQAMIPVFMTIMAYSGGYGEAAMIGPSIMGAAGVLSNMIHVVLLPAIALVTTMELINYLSEKGILTQFSALLKSIVGWSLKAMAIIFMMVLSIQKIGAPALNNALGKTAKAAVGAIPVVGDVMTGAVETAAALAGLLKSGAAASAIIFIIIICLIPLLKLIAMILIYKLTAAIAEPVCEPRLVKCISTAGDFSLLLLGALFTVEIMFLFSVILLLGVI